MLKKIKVATAVTISGTMMGRLRREILRFLPLKGDVLTTPMAAEKAIVVAMTAAIKAIVIEFQAAF